MIAPGTNGPGAGPFQALSSKAGLCHPSGANTLRKRAGSWRTPMALAAAPTRGTSGAAAAARAYAPSAPSMQPRAIAAAGPRRSATLTVQLDAIDDRDHRGVDRHLGPLAG